MLRIRADIENNILGVERIKEYSEVEIGNSGLRFVGLTGVGDSTVICD